MMTTLDDLIAHLQELRKVHAGTLPVYVSSAYECAPMTLGDVGYTGAYVHPNLPYLNLPDRISICG